MDNDRHADKHEGIGLMMEKLAGSINTLGQRQQEIQKDQQETRNLLQAAMSTLGYEYSQDAKRWVTKEKLEELRRKDK